MKVPNEIFCRLLLLFSVTRDFVFVISIFSIIDVEISFLLKLSEIIILPCGHNIILQFLWKVKTCSSLLNYLRLTILFACNQASVCGPLIF